MIETNTYKKLKDSPQDNYPEYIAVHHSAGGKNQDIKVIEDYHLSKGWDGIAYHYLISGNGDIYKGRPEHYHGAHSKEINYKSIGICLLGNFSLEMPSEAQKSSLTSLLSELVGRYQIKEIKPHRAFTATTECYGKLLPDDWASNLINTEEYATIKVAKSGLSTLKLICKILNIKIYE